MREAPQAKASPASQPISRLGCLLGGLAWLFVMLAPLLAFVLAARGELTWRRGEFVEDRLWLITAASASGGERGLGYSAARVLSDQTASGGPLCVRTRVRFLLWRGQSEQVEFCECYTRAANGAYEANGSCP